MSLPLPHLEPDPAVGEFPSPSATTRLLTEALGDGRISLDDFLVAMDDMIELAEFMGSLKAPVPDPADVSHALAPEEALARVRRLITRLDPALPAG